MTTKQTILQPDDFEIGMAITVLNGDCCEAGCCERYQQLKGIPMLILEVDLPYIVVGIAGGHFTHIDVRDCDLKRVTHSYAKLFGVVRAPQEPPKQSEVTDGQA